MFDRQPTLEGDRVLLRPLREEKFDALLAVASDPFIWGQHPARDPYRADVFRAFFQNAITSGGALTVIDLATGAIIGSSRFDRYDRRRSEIEIGRSFLARSH